MYKLSKEIKYMTNKAISITKDGDEALQVSIALNTTLNTNGKGFWSNSAKDVDVTDLFLHVGLVDDGDDYFGDSDLRVSFDATKWDTYNDGLVYTDKLFKEQLHALLISMGFDKDAVEDIRYSEQGMQGDDFISFDAYDFAALIRKQHAS